VSQGVHIMRGVRNQLLYFLMSDVYLLAKEEARYRQPTDVQEPKLSHAAVPTDTLLLWLRMLARVAAER
jgi:hypothetical protein